MPAPYRRSVIKDPIKPRDFRRLNLIFCCEQCTYFQQDDKICNLGFPSEPHQRRQQLHTYNLSGRMAFCRFLEID